MEWRSLVVFVVVILRSSATKSPYCGRNSFTDKRDYVQSCPVRVSDCAAVGLKESQLRCEECCGGISTTEKTPTGVIPSSETTKTPSTAWINIQKKENMTKWNGNHTMLADASEVGRDENKINKNLVIIVSVMGAFIGVVIVAFVMVYFKYRQRSPGGENNTEQGNPITLDNNTEQGNLITMDKNTEQGNPVTTETLTPAENV